jgi:AraC-like DNA-binding protein
MRKATFHQVMLPNLSVRILRDVLIEAGLNARRAFARAGLEETVADQPGAMVSAAQELDFQRGFVELTAGCYDLWIKAANRYNFPTLSVRGWALMTAPTLADWLTIAQDVDFYYSLIECRPLSKVEGKFDGLALGYNDAPAELAEFAVYRDVLASINSLNYIWQAPFPLTRVDLALPEISAELGDAIHAPIRIRQPVTQILWPSSLSSRPLPLGNELLYKEYSRLAAAQISELRFDGELSEQIVSLLRKSGQARLDLSGVAAQLHTSVRTLQRRLDKLGIRFRDLRDQARFDEAKALLTYTTLSISEIAWRLGYTESASFSAAFKRWSNAAPSDYRTAAVAERSKITATAGERRLPGLPLGARGARAEAAGYFGTGGALAMISSMRARKTSGSAG